MIVLYAVLGALLASFFMCLADRRLEKIPFRGRSFCRNCGKTLGPTELVPVLSYILLRGRCQACQQAIPRALPMGEGLLALAFAGLFLLAPSFELFLWHAAFACLLLYIAYVDVRSHRVEDGALLLMLGAIVVHGLMGFGPSWTMRLLGAIALILPLFILWRSRPEGLGLGDVLFAGLMGLLFGPVWAARAFLLGVVFALVVALLLLLQKKADGKTALPLLPFLALASWLVLMRLLAMLG